MCAARNPFSPIFDTFHNRFCSAEQLVADAHKHLAHLVDMVPIKEDKVKVKKLSHHVTHAIDSLVDLSRLLLQAVDCLMGASVPAIDFPNASCESDLHAKLSHIASKLTKGDLVQFASDDAVRQRYTLHEVIGRGAAGTVHRAIEACNRKEVAVKKVERAAIDSKVWQVARQEAVVLQQLQHKHIGSVKECLESVDNLYIIMDLYRGGELFDKLLEVRKYPEPLAAAALANLLSAVDYIHNGDMVHRDIKLDNLLLRQSTADIPYVVGPDGPTSKNPLLQRRLEAYLSDIVLVDFGMADRCDSNADSLTDCCGTPDYIAPEILECKYGRRLKYGKACDMWSVGIVAFVLLCGNMPFFAKTNQGMVSKIMKGDWKFGPEWDAISKGPKDFVSKLLVTNPAKRMTARQALAHPWIAQHVTRNRLQSSDSVLNKPNKRNLRSVVQAIMGLRALRKRVQRTALRKLTLADLLPNALPHIVALHEAVPLRVAFAFLGHTGWLSCPVVTAAGHFIGFISAIDMLHIVMNVLASRVRWDEEDSQEVVEAALQKDIPELYGTVSEAIKVRDANVRADTLVQAKFDVQSNLLEVIRDGFMVPRDYGCHVHRFALLSSASPPRSAVEILATDEVTNRMANGEDGLPSNTEEKDSQGCTHEVLGTSALPQSQPETSFLSGVITQTTVLKFLDSHPGALGDLAFKTLDSLGLARKPVKQLQATDRALHAFMVMQECNLTGLLVVDVNGRVLRDICVCDLTAVGDDMEKLAQPVASLIQSVDRPTVVCSPNIQLAGTIELMLSNKVRRVYVVDDDKCPIGVVTITDILCMLQACMHRAVLQSDTCSNTSMLPGSQSQLFESLPSATSLCNLADLGSCPNPEPSEWTAPLPMATAISECWAALRPDCSA